MQKNLPCRHAFTKQSIILTAILLLVISSTFAQSFKGKDGAASYSTAGTYIVNRYSALASSENAGSLSVTVANINELSGSYSFTGAANPYASSPLSKGDLIMIIQMQGVDVTTTDDANYGAITDYKNVGRYELRTVYSVSANTILLCQGLSNSYTQSGRSRAQVVRVPRLTTLTVNASAMINGLDWTGTNGGIVAIETSGDILLNGNITANAIGFRGGIDDITTSSASGGPANLFYRTTSTTVAAGKGESIAGNTTDYNTLLNGAYGRGTIANGGGGGNGHNSGGGGGSNAGTNGSLLPWNGTGIKNTSTPAWAAAWNFESANFATDISTGAGRGGYSFSNSNQDALVTGPGNTLWGGDFRNIVGGFGARPLNYNGNTRLFMGGGGGAGDGNNSSAGNAGKGGGIIYILTEGNISGTGTITASGQNGFNTQGSHIDAAGGGGGGGAVVALSMGTITGISIQANGGSGGNQLALSGEAEGPGGGGGGGYIATTTTSITRTVNGATNGISNSAQMTEFLPNGATQGSAGTITNKIYTPALFCNPAGYVLPVDLSSFTAVAEQSNAVLNWITVTEVKASHFEIERSIDGQSFTKIGSQNAKGNTTEKTTYSYQENISSLQTEVIYYRLKMVDADNKFSYSVTRIVRIDKQATTNGLSIYPNPAVNQLNVNLPANWQGQKVKFELYDITGKMTASNEKNHANNIESINMQNMVAGLYVVRASMGNQVLQQKIVKK